MLMMYGYYTETYTSMSYVVFDADPKVRAFNEYQIVP